MPTILPLKRRAFNQTDITAMSIALDDVCKSLEIKGDERAKNVIAARIVELAERGEQSPTALRDRVLREARGH